MEPIQNYQQSLLNQVFTQKLKENEKQTKTWMDYKKRHEKVIEGLRVFPLSISESCMVPIGKLAFMKGKLTHTNEILVCLGDGYFAKYSASQAIALCNRRIEGANEMLKSLEAERNLYDMRQILPLEHDIFGETDRKEILEHWNEGKLDEWRAQHKQRQKEYHQNLAKLREKEEKEGSNDHNEEELFKRLEELELKEELEDEICRLETERKGFYGDDLEEGEVYDESEEDDLSDSSEITMEMLEEELKRLKQIQANKITNSVSNASSQMSEIVQEVECSNKNVMENEQSNFVTNSNQKSLEENSFAPTDASESTKNTKEKRKVSFAELPCIIENEYIEDEMSTFEIDSTKRDDSDENSEDDNIVRIEILHSSHFPNVPESNATEIQSPVDIYKMFDASCPSTPSSKSILKKSPNDMPSEAIAPLNKDNSTDVEDEDEKGPIKSYTKSFEINDVVERKVIPSTSAKEEKKNAEKSMSRFKMKRIGILGN